MLLDLIRIEQRPEKGAQGRFIFAGLGLSNPLPRGAGGTPLAGSGRRPGEGRPGPGRLALIRRFAAPSPSGRRDKPPDRGKMKRP